MVVLALSAKLTAEDLRAAEERRGLLLAALLHLNLSQSDLHRLLSAEGEKTSPATVSNWCRGGASMTAVLYRGLLSLLGLDAAKWRPPSELVKRALEEQEARSRLPLEGRRRPRRAV